MVLFHFSTIQPVGQIMLSPIEGYTSVIRVSGLDCCIRLFFIEPTIRALSGEKFAGGDPEQDLRKSASRYGHDAG